MNETPQQYTARIVSNVANQSPLKVQADTPRKIERLIKGAAPEKLRKRPMPDKWSVREILAHLADVEIAVGWRVRLILGAPGTPVQAFDQDAWVEAGHYAKRNPHSSLAQMRALREANLALYRSLTPEQWKHHGMHAERGQETVEHITRMVAGHDMNHLRQIEEILRKKKTAK
jgi:DinB family protein